MQYDSLAFMFHIILCSVEVQSSEEWVNHLETSFMKLPLEQLFESYNLLSSEQRST